MFARIPSPAALRTFEAAARLGSFKAAAAELGVTPTAVSHQIRALEEMLDTPLFVRRTRAVELTEAGQRRHPHRDRLAAVTARPCHLGRLVHGKPRGATAGPQDPAL